MWLKSPSSAVLVLSTTVLVLLGSCGTWNGTCMRLGLGVCWGALWQALPKVRRSAATGMHARTFGLYARAAWYARLLDRLALLRPACIPVLLCCALHVGGTLLVPAARCWFACAQPLLVSVAHCWFACAQPLLVSVAHCWIVIGGFVGIFSFFRVLAEACSDSMFTHLIVSLSTRTACVSLYPNVSSVLGCPDAMSMLADCMPHFLLVLHLPCGCSGAPRLCMI